MCWHGGFGREGRRLEHGGAASTRCHLVDDIFELHQVPDCRQESVQLGTSTWFHAGQDPQLTYFLGNACECLTWGQDTAYYEAVGCYVAS